MSGDSVGSPEAQCQATSLADQRARARLAHDLRGPLTGILGISEVLLEENLSLADVHAFAARLHAEAKRLNQLITERLESEAG